MAIKITLIVLSSLAFLALFIIDRKIGRKQHADFPNKYAEFGFHTIQESSHQNMVWLTSQFAQTCQILSRASHGKAEICAVLGTLPDSRDCVVLICSVPEDIDTFRVSTRMVDLRAVADAFDQKSPESRELSRMNRCWLLMNGVIPIGAAIPFENCTIETFGLMLGLVANKQQRNA